MTSHWTLLNFTIEQAYNKPNYEGFASFTNITTNEEVKLKIPEAKLRECIRLISEGVVTEANNLGFALRSSVLENLEENIDI